jgi:sugar phosphate isomerase/epimerase
MREGNAMKLSLSVRVGEPPKQKDITAIPFPDLAAKAKALGYAGLSMRASVVSVESPPVRVREVRRILDDLGLGVSAVCGDIPLAANNADATRALHGITPYLDLTEAMGSRLVRIMMQSERDIPLARRAADEAAERGLTLMHINHWGTLFESVEESLETLDAIGRANVGVGFEPGNLLACRADYGPEALARLAPRLVNVFFQNVVFDPESPIVFPSRRAGPSHLRYVPIDDAAGIDIRPLIDTLHREGYEGWFTVHQPAADGQDIDTAMRLAAEFLLPRMAG